jgi:hypothetical protein
LHSLAQTTRIKFFLSDQYPSQTVIALQATPIDRLQRNIPFDSGRQLRGRRYIERNCGLGTLPSAFTRSQTFINGDSGNLKPEPLREFLHAYGEVLETEARKFHNRTFADHLVPCSREKPPPICDGYNFYH